MIEKSAFVQLLLCNIRGYLREPEAIFWTYGFPLLMILGLGVAFDTSGQSVIAVDLVEGSAAASIQELLSGTTEVELTVHSRDLAAERLRRNRILLIVEALPDGGVRYTYDSTNPESRNAQARIDEILQRAAGRRDPLKVEEEKWTPPGSRYVDFLVPGLIGMNLMGGGMWGVGFSLVDMRLRKLLKRLVGTPMRRPYFLLSIVMTRLIFFIPEAFVLLVAANLIFGVPMQGGILATATIALIGALAFAGLGLLAASRAARIETISGILNLVMLPMWLCSGVFFSAERFPAVIQPFIQALPLTQLINSLRAVILEGQGLLEQALPITILGLWATVSFILALRWFRWT